MAAVEGWLGMRLPRSALVPERENVNGIFEYRYWKPDLTIYPSELNCPAAACPRLVVRLYVSLPGSFIRCPPALMVPNWIRYSSESMLTA